MRDISVLERPEFTPERCSAIVELYNSIGWGPVTSEQIAAAYANTFYYILVEANGRVIGCLRAFSDDVYISWIAEIAVAASCQRQGIGRAMIQALDKRFAHTAVYVEALYDSSSFFYKCGIVPRSSLTACSRKNLV